MEAMVLSRVTHTVKPPGVFTEDGTLGFIPVVIRTENINSISLVRLNLMFDFFL